MTEPLRFRLYRSKLAAAESWKLEHERAMRARDVEDLVRVATESPDSIRQCWRAAISFWADDLESVAEHGVLLRDLMEQNLAYIQDVRRLARRYESAGHEIEGSERLESAFVEVERMRERLLSTWPRADEPFPPADPVLMEEALKAHRQGESQDVEDLIRELQGQDSKTD